MRGEGGISGACISGGISLCFSPIEGGGPELWYFWRVGISGGISRVALVVFDRYYVLYNVLPNVFARGWEHADFPMELLPGGERIQMV